jgi:O-antigen biosynthesis protein WbqV
MVLISTDKAVKPVSILGATKRLAEVYMEAIDQSLRNAESRSPAGTMAHNRARFLSVRFGNVLGSSGSVLQRFRAQIANRQPITVTHPDMVRYFMTVREAVNLVLQASSKALEQNAGEGSVFVLDMGEPIRIADMAERLIRLYGLEPGVDVPIIFTGMRDGERLYEEIFDADEPVHETDVDGVFAAEPYARPMEVIQKDMQQLLECIEHNKRDEAIAFLQDIVPGYAPK